MRHLFRDVPGARPGARPAVAPRGAWLCAAVVAAALLCAPATARAVTYETQFAVSEAQQEVEKSAQAYQEAKEAYDAAQAELDQARAAADQGRQALQDAEDERDRQQDRAAAALRASYRLRSANVGLVELALSSEDFNQFISMVVALNSLEERNTDELERLAELEQAAEEASDKLAEAEAQVQARTDEAEQACDEADRLRKEAEQLRDEAQQKALEENRREMAEGAAAGMNVTYVELPGVDWSLDRDAFVAEWGPRIDAYLGDRPLGGHGATFAAAAWDNGVDPRWSPAISNTESSRGLHCFHPYNAWGWGEETWPDWDTAIRAHVQGLARGYGYSITPAAARKYCPPNCEAWYQNTAAEMLKI